MNGLRRAISATLSALGLSAARAAQPKPDEAGRHLREMVLATTAERLNLSPSQDFPSVYGVMMDWPVSTQVATVVALSDGTASLYTTSSFGIIGGQAHPSVRAAGRKLIQLAERYVGESKVATGHPYPSQGQVFFYLLTYKGVSVISASLEQVQAGTGPHVALFNAAQEVLTELRRTVGK